MADPSQTLALRERVARGPFHPERVGVHIAGATGDRYDAARPAPLGRLGSLLVGVGLGLTIAVILMAWR